MKFQNLSVKRLFSRVAMGLALSMSGITIALFLVTKQIAVLLTGGALLLCALVGIFVLTQAFGKRLSQFTADLCQTLDHMIAGNEAPQRPEDSETQLARIGHRLARLYQIMQENRRRVDEERQELQTLVSDISHQVKTPVSNLKMATDTLQEKPMTEAERTDFIRGIRSQTDKLDFLFQALVKTSRLETGVIQLDKKPGRLFDTVAQAMSGIVYAAEKKEIAVSVDCPEDLTVSHDSKWTSEALFNLLDNAVKYTPAGGKIAVSVALWEMYVEVKVTDTGKGISESNQAAIFRRFYREEEVHEQQGVGIGLYLCDPDAVTKYIGRYLGRPVIALKRIDSYDGENVTFHYNRHEDNAYIRRTLPAIDFIRLLIQHIPEKHFKMIRYYGLYSRHREIDKKLHRTVHKSKHALIRSFTKWRQDILLSFGYDPLYCPHCKKEMLFVEIYHNHKRVPLQELYERAMAKAKCRSA